MADDEAVKVGGAYVENEDFVPNLSDMVSQFNTSGLGASGRIEEVAAIFEADKVASAQRVLAAFDEDDDTVSADSVHLPEQVLDNETAKEQVIAMSKKRVEQGVVIGGPTPAERAAEREGDDQLGLRAEASAVDAPLRSSAQQSVNEEQAQSGSDSSDDSSSSSGETPPETGEDKPKRVSKKATSQRS